VTVTKHNLAFDQTFDYGYNVGQVDDMVEVAISEFKAKCLSLLQQVRKTKQPIRVTRFGKPVADVVPSADVPVDRNAWIGSGKGTAKILGDIISPANGPADWEALRD
jgi:prevent-host-death family protein